MHCQSLSSHLKISSTRIFFSRRLHHEKLAQCLLFTLVTGIGFWIHSLEPCDKSKPGVEDKLLKKLTPSTPKCWKKPKLSRSNPFNKNEEDPTKKSRAIPVAANSNWAQIHASYGRQIELDRSAWCQKRCQKQHSKPTNNLTELVDKPNKGPQDKSKPDYNSKDGKNDSPMEGRNQSLSNLPSYDKKPAGFQASNSRCSKRC